MEDVAAFLHLLDLLIDHEVFEADATSFLAHFVFLEVNGEHYIVCLVEADAVALLDHLIIVHFVYAEHEVAIAS